MSKRCLYCYGQLDLPESGEYHEGCSLKFFGSKTPPEFNYTLDQMTELAKSVIERSVAVPGVQPKLSLTIVKDAIGNGAHGRLTIVGALGGNYIFKPPSANYPEMPQNEHASMRIAEEAFGIRTVPSSLIRLASGELSYITRRIDRTAKGEKIHMIDMFQTIEAFDKYKSSMERIGKVISIYSGNTILDQVYYFEIVLFSYLTGNNDMHLKNFSMLNSNGAWNLSPAYDLLNVTIANPKDNEELALTLEGKKSNFTLAHFNRFGAGLGLTERQMQNIYTNFKTNKEKAVLWLDRSFLSKEIVDEYKGLMDKRYSIFS